VRENGRPKMYEYHCRARSLIGPHFLQLTTPQRCSLRPEPLLVTMLQTNSIEETDIHNRTEEVVDNPAALDFVFYIKHSLCAEVYVVHILQMI